MPTQELEPPEQFFLNLVSSYSAIDLRDAITYDIDLAVIVQQEMTDYLEPMRQMVKIYDVTHPGYRKGLKNPARSARKVLEWLKVQRPDLGYEIEAYESYPTTTTLGFTANQPMQVAAMEDEGHVGLLWLQRQVESLAGLLL